MSDPFLPIECLGVVAFAVSGSMIAIRKGMDLFGVNVLGLFTAVGGGLFRDLVLGITPPQMLRDPTFAMIAIITSTVFFAFLYFYRKQPSERARKLYRLLLLYTDAVGLGVFTASGVDTAMRAYPDSTVFTMLFVALLTGTGGGILRDIMAGETPSVLVRHIYAVASLIGACVYLLLRGFLGAVPSTIVCAAVIVAIRGLASHYRWNFPHIHTQPPQT
ncbi:MAG TPA: trimeric intracellular cation channel family protein [Candidatus Limiplasma sp.]|nr:trimeric intracellular cation channel family protein [Candidatus Limiplasma sp.]HPS81699.1 trimeric intracellular cation channel family protein [Candidatus Limiplasma sp.]